MTSPDRAERAIWSTSWPSYPVLAFDLEADLIEAFLIGQAKGIDPEAVERDFTRLRLQAAVYLARHRAATVADLKMAREFIRGKVTIQQRTRPAQPGELGKT